MKVKTIKSLVNLALFLMCNFPERVFLKIEEERRALESHTCGIMMMDEF